MKTNKKKRRLAAIGIAAALAVAAAVGVVVMKKHGSAPPSDAVKTHQQEAAPSDGTLTATGGNAHEEAAGGNAHEEPAADDNAHEETGETIVLDSAEGPITVTVLPLQIHVPDADEPLVYRSFWQEVGEKMTVEAMQSDPERAKKILLDLAEKYSSGNPDMAKILYLDAEFKMELKESGVRDQDESLEFFELKEKTLGLDEYETGELIHFRYMRQFNNEDGKEVMRQTKPVTDLFIWMETHAPGEYKKVRDVYYDAREELEKNFPLNDPQAPFRYTHENFPTIEERARTKYMAFLKRLGICRTMQRFSPNTLRLLPLLPAMFKRRRRKRPAQGRLPSNRRRLTDLRVKRRPLPQRRVRLLLTQLPTTRRRLSGRYKIRYGGTVLKKRFAA